MPNDSLARKIVQKLVSHGHIAYFAGGWVRDFIMGRPSEDIDIATSASPSEILDLFPHTLLVGIQFGVVIVIIEGHPFEVATFRKDLDYKDGRKPEQIEQTSPEIDALRRDFTINGLFYDPLEDKIHDFVGGKEDIERGIVRAIGNPYDRFFDDRLRMIRAFRFTARFNFHMDPETEQAIEDNAPGLFPAVAMERIWQEFSKMSAYPNFERALVEMHRTKLLQVIFPQLEKVPLHEFEKRVAPIKHYPKNAPPALFLSELFPSENLEELGRFLTVSNKDLAQLNFYTSNAPFDIRLARTPSVHFYAHPDSTIALEVYAARLDANEAKVFLQSHKDKRFKLKEHIDRLVHKTPVISSAELKKAGIVPGVHMGLLLKEGERLAIENDLSDPEAVLQLLKRSPHWPKCTN